MNKKIVLFDLDGTIMDSASTIIGAIVETLAELGLPEQTEEQLREWVGPPLFHSFKEFAKVDPQHIDNAIATYRRNYSQTMHKAPLFEGILECLQELHQLGYPMAIATSKADPMAKLIVKKAGLEDFFLHVVGAKGDAANQNKASVIKDALTLLKSDGYRIENAVMIGDRIHDIEGASLNGLEAIGVLWGGTHPAEFENAYAVARTPSDLTKLIIESR